MRPCSRWGFCSSILGLLSWLVRVSCLPLSGLVRFLPIGSYCYSLHLALVEYEDSGLTAVVSAGEYGYDSATHVFSESVDYFVSTDDSFERVVFEKCLGCFSPVVVGSFSSDARNEFINHVSRIIP